MKYCCEDISKIENYELAKKDDFKGWVIHHRLELVETGAAVDSAKRVLIYQGLYYNRPASELIYLTKSDHQKLHRTGKPGPNRGKHFSEEHKRKILESKKGKKCVKGLYCIDLYDEDNNLVKEEVIKGVSMVDLWNGLNKAAGDSTQLDCSSAVAFQNKFRKGRDVKLTNKGTKEVLLGRIRQLEKRVEFLEEENKQLKVRVEKVEKAVVELKETKADKSEVVKKEDLVAFKNWVVGYCAKGKNKLTKDAIEDNGYKELFTYLVLAGILTSSKDYYFIHWDLLKDCISKAGLEK